MSKSLVNNCLIRCLFLDLFVSVFTNNHMCIECAFTCRFFFVFGRSARAGSIQTQFLNYISAVENLGLRQHSPTDLQVFWTSSATSERYVKRKPKEIEKCHEMRASKQVLKKCFSLLCLVCGCEKCARVAQP